MYIEKIKSPADLKKLDYLHLLCLLNMVINRYYLNVEKK